MTKWTEGTERAVSAGTVSELGEAEVLRRVISRLGPASDASSVVLLGPGDDSAVVAAPDSRYVITSDMMIEGPDFRREWSSPEDLGWKAAASNLADVAAMGAVPTVLTIALATPKDTPVEFLERFAEGMRDALAAMAPSAAVVGGDLSNSSVITIAVTALGNLQGRAAVTRSGARPGHVLAVAGPLGWSAAGLSALFASAEARSTRDVDKAAVTDAVSVSGAGGRLLAAQLRPTPPIAAGVRAAVAGATSMMDLSDGLAIDGTRLARASGVKLVLDPAAIESAAGALRAQSSADGAGALTLSHARDLVVFGGEDHSLLATFTAEAAVPSDFTVIGVVKDAPGAPGLELSGLAVPDRGWDPWRS